MTVIWHPYEGEISRSCYIRYIICFRGATDQSPSDHINYFTMQLQMLNVEFGWKFKVSANCPNYFLCNFLLANRPLRAQWDWWNSVLNSGHNDVVGLKFLLEFILVLSCLNSRVLKTACPHRYTHCVKKTIKLQWTNKIFEASMDLIRCSIITDNSQNGENI